jgi:FkbM family methyltransferase
VIVFEPAEAQVECIRRNLAGPLQEGRVVLIPKGVWDRDEQLTLSHWEDNPAGHSVVDRRGPTGETIPLTTIDAAVRELGLQRLDVIKMDVEGAEVRALRGARETLERFRPRLAVATEHTSDFLQNNRDVLATVGEVAPFYRHRCGYCRLDSGRQIIPETLYFDPR